LPDGLAAHRIDEFGSDFSQWLENESTLGELGVRYRKVRPLNNFVSVENDVDIESARTFVPSTFTLVLSFDREARLE